MTLDLAHLLAAILLPLLLGLASLRAIGLAPRSDAWGHLGWAWMSGALLTAGIELLWLLLGRGLPSLAALECVLLGAAGACFVLGRRVPCVPSPAPDPRERTSRWGERVFAAVVLFLVAVTLVRLLLGSLRAIVDSDEAITWSYRAKVLFEAGGFGATYAERIAGGRVPNTDYPLLNPLLELWIFLQAGAVTHVANRLPIQLCSVALVLCTGSALRRASGPWFAALLLPLLLPEGPTGALRAYSDGMVELGAVVALDGYLRWRASGQAPWLRLASLALAFLLGSKHEGVVLACSFLAALLVTRILSSPAARASLRPRRAHLWLLPGVLAVLVTWIHNAWFHVRVTYVPAMENPVTIPFAARVREHFIPTLRYLFGEVLLAPEGRYVLLGFLVLVVLAPRLALGPQLRRPTLALLFALAGLTCVYLGTSRDLDWLLRTSMSRVLSQLTAVALLWIALASRALLPRALGAPEVPAHE